MNKDKCGCECKELIDKGVCDKEYIWNPSNCECECNKSCGFSEYLDYKNCKCKKRLVDKSIDECTEIINEITLVKINSSKCKHNSCILYVVLFWIFFTINSGISTYYVYSQWYFKKRCFSHVNVNNHTQKNCIQTTIY